MKRLAILILTLTVALFAANTSFASYGAQACQPIYGGGQTCITVENVLVDKKVLHPTQKTKGNTDLFVDNLTLNDPKYQAGQIVKFEITVKNTSDSTLDEVTVTDLFPTYIDFVKGPGSFNTNTKVLTFKVINLNPNEARKFIVEAKVVASNMLPSGQMITCVANQATAEVSGKESKDNSQFCVEKTVGGKGLPVQPAPKIKQTPPTGPEMLPLIGMIPAGIAGFMLRRKASK